MVVFASAVLSACGVESSPTGTTPQHRFRSGGVNADELVCVSKYTNFAVHADGIGSVSASVQSSTGAGTVALDEWICGYPQAGAQTLTQVTVTSDLPQFSSVDGLLSGIQVYGPAYAFPGQVSEGGTTATPVAGTTAYGPAPKPDWMTDAEWADLGEYLQRAFTSAMKRLCNDSSLQFVACGLLRSGALKTAVRNTQNAVALYPYGIPSRTAQGLLPIDPAEFGRRWAYATAEFVRQIRLASEFSDVSQADLTAAATELALGSMADALARPEQSIWYEPSLTEAARRAYFISPTDLNGPRQVAEGMFNQGNLFPSCAPTFDSSIFAFQSCQRGGGGGDSGGGTIQFKLRPTL